MVRNNTSKLKEEEIEKTRNINEFLIICDEQREIVFLFKYCSFKEIHTQKLSNRNRRVYI